MENYNIDFKKMYHRYLHSARRDGDRIQQHLPNKDVRPGVGRHLRSSLITVHLHRVLLSHAPLVGTRQERLRLYIQTHL